MLCRVCVVQGEANFTLRVMLSHYFEASLDNLQVDMLA